MNAHFSELFEYIRVIAGTSYDTSEFAVESISRWRETLGKHTLICEPYRFLAELVQYLQLLNNAIKRC